MFIEVGAFTVALIAAYVLGILTMPLLLYFYLTAVKNPQSAVSLAGPAGESPSANIHSAETRQVTPIALVDNEAASAPNGDVVGANNERPPAAEVKDDSSGANSFLL